MGFNVKSSKKENIERVDFILKDSGWSIANVRVVTEHVVSFTLKMRGLSLYNMKVTESTKGGTAGKMFLSNGSISGLSSGTVIHSSSLVASAQTALIIMSLSSSDR